ncbi:PREDICTED: very-long-chain (3R)-3-hydroxyacyl-CoA dehydratase [Nicrophorus vespilloides]|uniref:Very-long-chain (3R)-3-hydroxyacyl-CoA dehydratase n=1 Tax=Nicrophorus vespilloides TaxID=110193 RepID=A0ABM1MIM3_NICVS|nr:PREDICTED: very-long-chain (3R)-3-hydroxyacyl-CoA dehydratase [Nicrophorus vespilloides]
MPKLSPFIYWAQNEELLYIKVELRVSKDVDVILESKNINFSALGAGSQGLNEYAFKFDFYADIDPDESTYKVTDSIVDFTIVKAEKGWWSRLMKQQQKPAWLKIDFQRWQNEECLNDDDEDEKVRDIREDYPQLYKNLQKEERGFSKEDGRKVYLAFYNFGMFIGFIYVFCVMATRFLRDGADSYASTYEAVGPAMIVLQMMQFLEIMHPLFGYTKGSVMTASMQVMGRALVLFALIDSEPRMQTKPVIFYLFLVWTSIELIRYPYYITQVYNQNNGFLTWLRYTIWIPLYPMGFICEGVIMLRSIPYFEETQQFSFQMPNKYNFIFSFPLLLRVYLLFFFLPGIYVLMSHMYKLRCKKLGTRKRQQVKKVK